MSENPQRDADKDPEPLKHVDAERVGNEREQAQEIEDDPARDPDKRELRDAKGG